MMRRFVGCWIILGIAACDQAQTPSNVGGDGIDPPASSKDDRQASRPDRSA